MNLSRPSAWLVVALGAIASVAEGFAAAPGSTPSPRPAGDSIEFTQPRETTPVRPTTGGEPPGARFNSSRRDTPADGADLVSSMPLPAPTDVNRLRLLQELLGRRSQSEAFDAGVRGQTGMRFDDGRDMDSLSPRMSIDDLFERQRGRLGSDETESGDNRRSPGNREDRGGRGERPSDREREFDTSADAESGSGSDNREGSGAAKTANRGPAESARNQSFLPDSRAGEGEFRDSLLGNRRSVDDGLAGASEPMTTRFGLGLRDTEDPVRAREERMESFRRILGGGTTVDSWLSPGTRSVLGDAKAGPGGVGLPGGATSGARTLGAALDGRPGAGTAGAGPMVDGSPDRTFAVPARPVEMNLGVGRAASSGMDAGAAIAPAMRPMELFQRKHDTRLPSRGF
jgi:hypothetical protein